MTIDAVVFDIGNVLIEWHPEAFYDRVIGENRRRDMFAALDLHAMNDRVDQGQNFTEVVTRFAEANPDWGPEVMMWHDRWIEMAAPAIDHSVRLLRALRRAGVPVFALSNFGIETFEIGRAEYPFLEEFDRAFISGHMGVTKPDPKIFAMVEDDCGIAPDRLLFTDDREENTDAAAMRGWQTHHFVDPEGIAARLVGEGLLTEVDAK